MRKKKYSSSTNEQNTWMPLTDMLSSTLMITFLFIAVTTLIRAMNAKPPVINLPDTEEYRFNTGSFTVNQNFSRALNAKAIPEIENTIFCYGIDTIEIVGHTDGRPNTGRGNIDQTIEAAFRNSDTKQVITGSNLDLGFMRAMSVKAEIEKSLLTKGIRQVNFRILSAGSTINEAGEFMPAANTDQRSRRRIEIRFLRRSKAPFIPQCN
jgi:hypothetical protein